MSRSFAMALVLALLPLWGCGDDSDGPGGDMGGFQLVTDLPPVQALGAVWSFSPSDVWLTADSGRVLHFDGSGWSETQLETQMMMLDIWGSGPNDVWMVGGETLARYDGADWTITDLTAADPGIEGDVPAAVFQMTAYCSPKLHNQTTRLTYLRLSYK